MPVSNNQNDSITSVIENVDPIQGQVIQASEMTQESQSANGIPGLSATEMNDPASIKVTVSDSKAPLVILFGPPQCGKTMTLVQPYVRSVLHQIQTMLIFVRNLMK